MGCFLYDHFKRQPWGATASALSQTQDFTGHHYYVKDQIHGPWDVA